MWASRRYTLCFCQAITVRFLIHFPTSRFNRCDAPLPLKITCMKLSNVPARQVQFCRRHCATSRLYVLKYPKFFATRDWASGPIFCPNPRSSHNRSYWIESRRIWNDPIFWPPTNCSRQSVRLTKIRMMYVIPQAWFTNLRLRIPCPPPFSVPTARFLPHSYSPQDKCYSNRAWQNWTTTPCNWTLQTGIEPFLHSSVPRHLNLKFGSVVVKRSGSEKGHSRCSTAWRPSLVQGYLWPVPSPLSIMNRVTMTCLGKFQFNLCRPFLMVLI